VIKKGGVKVNIAIILAGGCGTRVGGDLPKQFINVLGKPILAYTLEIFEKNRNIDAIEVVCNPFWKEKARQIVEHYSISKTKWIVDGGNSFQQSAFNGLLSLKGKIKSNDIVVISFGVSPMTTDEVINDSIDKAMLYGNGISSEDMVMCTCIKDNDESTVEAIPREKIKGFANPWSFKFGEVLEAYEEGKEKGILDKIDPHTTSLYLALGKRLYFSKGTNNICKITYKEDIKTFEGWLLVKMRENGEISIKEKGNA
jgi:2-C-methyl-D-erythritol 4-phosphate cytidylyltransferase